MKKIVLKCAILLVIAWITISFNISAAKSIPLGDLDEDGIISVKDSSILKSYLIDKTKLDEKQMAMADLNQDGKITITDYALLKSVILGFKEQPFFQETVYDVELEKFNIKNNGMIWENNAIGITEAIRYAKENDYQEIRFPTGTYVIKAPTPIMIDSKKLIINFNNSTIKMQEEPYSSHWCMIDLREPAEDVTIKNGIMQGNRFSDQFDSSNPYNEGTIPFSIKAGNRILIENLTIKDSTGYGMTIDTGMNRTKKVEIWANEFEKGSISEKGELEENENTMRSKKFYSVGDLGGEFEIGYTAGYQGYGSILNQEYKAYFYDKDKNLISSAVEKQYVKSSLPTNCQYLKIVISQSQIKDGSEGSAFITNAKTFRNSVIKNCTFDANSAVGLTIGGGHNFIIENCDFTRNGIDIDGRPSLSAKVAIDIEDGWECMQNITLRENTFKNNRYDFTSCAGSNLVLEKNSFSNGCSISARSTNYTVTNNQFQGPVEFGVSMGGKVNHNTYTDCSIHTFYQKFGNDTQTTTLNMTNETFRNSSIYAQNLDSKKQNQVVKYSSFTTSDNKKVWLKGEYDNCTFEQASIFNSAILKNCHIQNTNMYAQASSTYQNCEFKNGNIITNSAEEIAIQNSKLYDVPIEITTWAGACKLTIENSTLVNTDSNKNILRLSAGKAKDVQLLQNTISSVNDVIQFFDTSYSPPNGKLQLIENTISIPENNYVINGTKIETGKYQIECKKNTLNTNNVIHSNYQNSANLTVIIEGTIVNKENKNLLASSFTIAQSKFLQGESAAISQNAIPSFYTKLETSNQKLVLGEEFEVIIKLENYQNIEDGLLAFSGQLDYDKNILEKMSIEGKNDWIFEETSFNEENGRFLIDTNQYSLTPKDILKIRFKVKQNSTFQETVIGVKNMIASNAITDIISQDSNLNVTITQEKEDEDETTPPENNEGESTTPENNTNTVLLEDNSITNNIIHNKNDITDSIANGTLPQTGVKEHYFVFVLILVFSGVAIFARIRYYIL